MNSNYFKFKFFNDEKRNCTYVYRFMVLCLRRF